MYFLDSDIFTAYLEGHRKVVAHILALSRQETCLSMLTVEESLQGYLSVVQRFRSDPVQVQAAYGSLQRFLLIVSAFPIVNYPNTAEIRYASFSPKSKRIGAFDCRLVAHAVVENAIIVTRNLKDFERIRENEDVSEVSLDNWMD